MKNYLLAGGLLMLASCNPQAEKKREELPKINMNRNNYPVIIDSLGIRDIYDSARWLIYCNNCDQKLLFIREVR